MPSYQGNLHDFANVSESSLVDALIFGGE